MHNTENRPETASSADEIQPLATEQVNLTLSGQTMRITCPEEAVLLSDCRADQIALVHEVHEYLLQHLGEKITIDELSRQFHMNATTLKAVFKSVYGDSIASHMKAHRMEKAAALLSETGRSIAEVAQEVGYDSQSKFSSAFRERYGILPKDYRKSEHSVHPQ